MIPKNKLVADLITWSRALLAPVLLWLGFVHGANALPIVIVLMVINWTGDSIDGILARRAPLLIHTWIGDHDLEVDMAVSIGLLGYLTAADLVAYQASALYLLLWLLLFWRKGLTRSLGMLFQAPIYGWFIYVVIRNATAYGFLLLLWIVAAVLISWPKFPKVIVPGFLAGMRAALEKHRGNGSRL